MTLPSPLEFLDASNAVYNQNIFSIPSEFTLLDPIDLSNLEDIQNGFYAQAFRDSSGKIIISYEGSYPNPLTAQFYTAYGQASDKADVNILLGEAPDKIFQDAVAFAKEVDKDFGGSDPIYVTGHSLGGAEAEEVAETQTFVIGGATFGAPGLPGYTAPAIPTSNFDDYVDYGDPVGTYAKDTIGLLSRTGDHFGTVIPEGSTSNDIAGIVGHDSLPILLYDALTYHSLQNYAYDLGYDQFSSDTSTLTYSPNLTYVIQSTEQSSSPPISGPIITDISTLSTTTGHVYALTALFPTTETPSNTGHYIAYYTLIFVRGSGTITVNNATYSVGSVVTNISPAAFAAGYLYTGATPGINEVAAVAFDDQGTSSNEADVTISVTGPAPPSQPINTNDDTPPTVIAPASLPSVSVGGGTILSSVFLQTSDTNSSNYSPTQLLYVISDNPQNGYLLKNGSIIASFTQQDVDDNLIEYQQNGTPDTADSFSYYVVDPNGDRSSTATLAIHIDVPPAVTNPVLTTDSPLIVGQGLTALITDSNLYVADPGLQGWQIIYHVTSGPSDGVIVAGGPQPFFTQQEVDLGLVTYKSNGETSGSDLFTFNVTDNEGGSIGPASLAINIVPSNNLQVDNNRPVYLDGSIHGFIGNIPSGTSLLSQDILYATDPGVSTSNIIYTVQSLPNFVDDILIGSWLAPSGNQSSFNPIREIIPDPSGGFFSGGVYGNYFTQAEIDSGEVYVLVNTQTTAGLQSAIPLTVSDNVGNTISSLQLPVVVEPSPVGVLLNDQYVPGNQITGQSASLTAGIGQTTVISDGLMNMVNALSTSDQDEYEVWTVPSEGTLLLNGVSLTPNSTFNPNSAAMFTQQEVDDGDLVYDQNGTPVQSDEFGLFVVTNLTQYFANGIEGILQVNVTTTGTHGGQVLSGTSSAETLNPGEGNNYLFGDGSTTISYANSPNPVSVDLSAGTVQNGYGGTDTITNIDDIIGSPFNDTFIAGTGDETFSGGGGSDTVVFSGQSGNYQILQTSNGTVVVSNQTSTDLLLNIQYVEFSDRTLDISVPSTPASVSLAPSSDTDGGDVTNIATPVITGTGEPGDVVTLLDGSDAVGCGTVGENGDWSITTSVLALGEQALIATETNAAGIISSASAPLDVTIGDSSGLLFEGTSAVLYTDDETYDASASTTLIIGQGADETVAFSGNRADYSITYSTDTQTFTITDQRSGGPDGTNVLEGISDFQFQDQTINANSATRQTVLNADGTKTETVYDSTDTEPWSSVVSTYNAADTLISQIVNQNDNDSIISQYDPANEFAWSSETSVEDGLGNLISQTINYNDGTHSLSAFDNADTQTWAQFSVSFDADWSITAESGTFHDGSAMSALDIAAAMDTIVWDPQPPTVVVDAESTAASQQVPLSQAAATLDPAMMNAAGALVLDQFASGQLSFEPIGGLGPEWEFGGAGTNLLGDGSAGFLIRNDGTSEPGALFVGEIANGSAHYTPIGDLNAEWQFAGNADFLGTGQTEFLIRNTGTVIGGALDLGQVVATASGLSVNYTQVGGLGPEWEFGGAGTNLLGDGSAGFLIRNDGTSEPGALFVGEIANGTVSYTPIGGVGTEWDFEGTGDFLGDGNTGFLIWNSGTTDLGAMAIGEVVNGQLDFTDVGGVGPEWQFVGTGNYIDSNRTDFLLRNSNSGALVVGSITGTTGGTATVAYAVVGGIGSEWTFHNTTSALMA